MGARTRMNVALWCIACLVRLAAVHLSLRGSEIRRCICRWLTNSTEYSPYREPDIPQLIKICPAPCGNWRLITVLTADNLLSLSWVRRIISTIPYNFSKLHRILSVHLCLGLPTDFFPFRFHHHVIYTSIFCPLLCYMLRPSHPAWFDHSNYIRWGGISRDKWVPVTTAWRVLRLRMEERPPIWRVAANIYWTLSGLKSKCAR